MLRTARLLLAILLLLVGAVVATPDATSPVVSLRVEGAIGPATSDYVSGAFRQAQNRNASLILIEMDTPGGLDSAMRVIIKAILASPIPVATYVTPEGARAASAGTYILYASHIAAMAPATNLGAATPVAIGGSPEGGAEPSAKDKPAEKPVSGDASLAKAANDATAYLRSLAQLRGRDTAFAEQAVRDAASITAEEALKKGVIDIMAADRTALLQQLHGREIKLDSGRTATLATRDAAVEEIAPDWRHDILALLSNPQVAMVLMMIGIYGLFFEFTSPGFGVPGVAGLICLLLALYAFQLLPVNWAGVALIALGAALMLAEAFVPSFGVLGIGGIVAFVTGGLLLFDRDIPGYGLPLPFLIGCALFSALVLIATGMFAVRSRRRSIVSGAEYMLGADGQVISASGNSGYAHIQGERWQISSRAELTPGQRVRVIALNGLTLEVEPTDSQNPARSQP